MCRTKLKLVKEPIPLKPSSRKPRSSDEILISTSKSTDSGVHSSSLFSKGSTSSAQSLASYKDLLPDNPNIYAFKEITLATNHFRYGKLGNSSVWKCTLRNKPVVVTERIRTGPVDFRAKLREICSVHHRSIVELLGVCEEEDRLYLVYQYVEGSSMKECLRGSKAPGYTVLSSWLSRIQIAVDVAQGLEYMHHDISFNYVHKYIKSSSIIIVGPDLNARITHFGTSELTGELSAKHEGEQSSSTEITEEDSGETSGQFKRSRSRKIIGSQGYMAPEFAASGKISQKTDIFAFGMVLLELLTGQEPVKFSFDATKNQYKRVSLTETLFQMISESDFSAKLRTWIDPRLKDSYPVDSAEKVAKLAATCVDIGPHDRPDMRHVAGELSKIYLKSKKWSEELEANKAFMSTTMEAR
ncbi:hypothetical protein SUGI_0433840 [Cryptomeria japonica]|uniref:lysM domain receptor-like kinase 3 n=1 Tax=Cryptomeria japonica TaxID=3369 RepID=UPI0024089960|nr:lysM domain receptor-like kinase 3 [Cryptomeria japonica]XP_057851595.2 lysM domain receptor-like kinase 3 [Cryptomeria japonica]XP_057851597.2 lysM domain receptor-like kinase 3 [Cryptomeria japonica]XP_057851598.2 lysM domain receptor-like kinase 3 [Cryptomeria japonica]GLJ22994.1 hypothetical protein SUGI_0433840 [Cryptomeria japonica]